ncbi:MAG TPA: thioesterase family protein [Myxococcota bacterium]|nr:thioesterase family protein [Myxococcota bacterium]
MIREKELPRPDDFRFQCEVEVRFRDLDAMGHVNNAAYFTYFEVARTGYMRALGHSRDEDDLLALYPFILLEVRCRFVSPAGLSERLLVFLRTAFMGSKSFVFEYLITGKDDSRVVAVGRSIQVYYDYQKKCTLPIPDNFRARIETFEFAPK